MTSVAIFFRMLFPNTISLPINIELWVWLECSAVGYLSEPPSAPCCCLVSEANGCGLVTPCLG